MTVLERIGLAFIRRLDPETAHGVALTALNAGLGPKGGPFTTPRLKVTLAGLELPNPLGIAAGFDKNAVALGALAQTPLGFVELGGTTPRPQPGNPKPRLFRLPEDSAVINRFGFNNEGMDAMAARLAKRPKGAVVGLNLGANKDSPDRTGDYAQVLQSCGPYLDFATVNVSSPNTERLRELQGKQALRAVLDATLSANRALPRPLPIFLKISPDLSDDELTDIAEVATEASVSAIIATNTTLARDGLQSRKSAESGGLSGRPLFDRSTRVLAHLSELTELPLIGVGGIASGQDAYAKIRAGATALQLYTGLVYGGLALAIKILEDLDSMLKSDGYSNVHDAIGTGRSDWL